MVRHGSPEATAQVYPDPQWRKNKQGYIVRRVTLDGKRYQQLQHRVVMEGVLGRPLLSEENVHHKNKIRDDNRPENLELWNTSQPPGARVEDLLDWARRFITLYDPQLLLESTDTNREIT